MDSHAIRPELAELLPAHMRKLPIDPLGAPITWHEKKGRAPGRLQFESAIRAHKCWQCGGGLGKALAFVLTPREYLAKYAEAPPSHPDCATYVARVGLESNPDTAPLAVVWAAESYRVEASLVGYVMHLGEPRRVNFYERGRVATRAAILAALTPLLPKLDPSSPGDVLQAFENAIDDALFWVPSADERVA